MTPKTVLTLAGSDSGAGAGVQADLKTIAATGQYGVCAITAITAQNTLGVQAIHPLPLSLVRQQLQSLAADFQLAAMKIGMLHSQDLAALAGEFIAAHPHTPAVLDPVLVATQGQSLADSSLVKALLALLPLARLITPNLSEAAALLATQPAQSMAAMQEQAQGLLALGAQAVLMKGGHLPGDQAIDLLVTTEGHWTFTAPKLVTGNTHGTGCTLSSAIASHLATGLPLVESVAAAKAYLSRALAGAQHWQLGGGQGPVDHFAALVRAADRTVY